jgi:hypothetical protein
MSTEPSAVLQHKAVNAWNLCWLIAGPISIAMVVAMAGKDLSGPDAVSSMIQLSVRCAVPLLYIAFAVSSVKALFPGVFSRWLVRNRKYLGLSFAAAMAWQAFFILWLVTVYTDYYVNEVYVLRDAIEGVTGYLFLIAMTVTSFGWGRRPLNPRQWRLLHVSGIYFLWAYAFSVYWWALFYYSNPVWIDHVYYWAGLLAWVLRAAAWSRKRRKLAEKDATLAGTQPVFRMTGIALVGIGLIAASLGSVWRPTAEELLYGYAFTRIPELYLPYWPFEPFLPLAVILLGAYLITTSGGGTVRERDARDRQTGGALGA